MFTVGYKRQNENNWLGYKATDTLDDARIEMHALAQTPGVRIAAVFTETQWMKGPESHGPMYIIDKTDRSGESIKGLGGLIGSLPSDYF